jgi:hypothetical protein
MSSPLIFGELSTMSLETESRTTCSDSSVCTNGLQGLAEMALLDDDVLAAVCDDVTRLAVVTRDDVVAFH